MLSDAAFHVMMYVSWLVGVVGLGGSIWLFIIGGVGCVYSVIGSVHLSASISNCWVGMGMCHVGLGVLGGYDVSVYIGI